MDRVRRELNPFMRDDAFLYAIDGGTSNEHRGG